jgi:hypothetical protein
MGSDEQFFRLAMRRLTKPAAGAIRLRTSIAGEALVMIAGIGKVCGG